MKNIRILLNKYESSPTVIVEDEVGEIENIKTFWGLTHKQGVPQLKSFLEDLGYDVFIDDSEQQND